MILLKNGFLIDPDLRVEKKQDILIKGAAIYAVEKPGEFKSTGDIKETYDLEGSWVVPGLIDLHVHLREPGFEWKETIKTGAEAALLGGYTAICAMPNTDPRNDCGEVTAFILDKAKKASAAKVYPIGSVSKGLLGKEMTPLTELFEAGCVAFSDDGEPIYDSALMRRALEWCYMFGGVISCHEEDKALSNCGCANESALTYKLGLKGMPKVAEEVMIARDIELSRTTKGKIHICHISTKRGVELVRRAKNDGIPVTAEVTPHHLVLTEDAIKDYDTNAKMSPPLREQEDCDALWEGLRDGTIDAIASDHAPHEADSKQVEFSKASFGILGLQTSLSLMIDSVNQGKISKEKAIYSMTTGPAKAFNLKGGRLKSGDVADIVIVDPLYKWKFDKEVIKSKSKNSPFLNHELSGGAKYVFVDGQIKVKDFQLS